MPKRPPKNPPKTDRTLAAKSAKTARKTKTQHIVATGPATRIQGHVAAHGRRSQAKRDAR